METYVGDREFNPYEYEGSPAVNVTYGYLATLFGVLAFSAINYAAILIGPSKKMKADTWRWRNTLVSWIHADIIGVGVLYCLLFRPEVFSDDMILYCDYFIYVIVAFSLGYFLYDFLDHVLNGMVMRNYEVILHHVAVIWSFCYTIQYKVNAPYTIIALMVEVNSIFLHARKLMQFDQWPFNHWLYKVVVGLNLITFVRFRLWGIILVGLGIYIEWYRMTLAYRVFIVTSMTIMYLINPILFWRLLKNDVIRNCYPFKYKDKRSVNGVKGKMIDRNGEVNKHK